MAEDLEAIVTAGAAAALEAVDGKLPEPVVELTEAEKIAGPAAAVVPPLGEVPKVPTTEELDDLGLTKQQQLEARQLFAALQDPNKSKVVIDFLAQNAGYSKPPETKAEVKEVAKGMVDELKEALGPELAYLAEKMGPVFEKHLKTQTEESIKPLRAKQEENDLAALRTEGDRVQELLATKYFGSKELPDNVVKKASEVMNTYNATPGQSMEDYLENVLFIASGKLGIQLKAGTSQQQQSANRAARSQVNAPANLANRAQPGLGERSGHPSRQQALPLEDAVHLAMKQAEEAANKN